MKEGGPSSGKIPQLPITVDVRAHGTKIVLKDKDPDFRNPRVVQTDFNKRNKQIAHGINRVLLPVNL